MTWYKRLLYFFCSTCRPNRSRTVRYAFPLVFGALVVLSALTISSEDGTTTIEIVPSKTEVSAGEALTLDVYVDSHTPVNAIDIEIDIPSSQLEVTGIDTGESVITLWTEDPYVDGNTVVLRGGTFRKGFLGRHLIVNINTRAREAGQAHINVTNSLFLAGDGSGSEVASESSGTEGTTLYIANSDGTYEPGDEPPSKLSASLEVRIITDIDGDGEVSLSDVSRFMSSWFARDVVYDFSGDGRMTFRDFSIILAEVFFR